MDCSYASTGEYSCSNIIENFTNKLNSNCTPGYLTKIDDKLNCWSLNEPAITTPKVCDPINASDKGLICDSWDNKTARIVSKPKVCPNGYTLDINGTCSICPSHLLFDPSSNQCIQKLGLSYPINNPPKCQVGYTWDQASTCNPDPILKSIPTGTIPNTCPEGYIDIVNTCKKMWGNQTTPKTCSSDKDMIANLCYNKCPYGYDRVPGMPTMCKSNPNAILNPIPGGTPPDQCPQGYTNFGFACKKGLINPQTTPKTCSSDKDMIGSLCYNKCPYGYDRVPGMRDLCKTQIKSYKI